jgi:dTDP-4-amino-4,6-dideoxygalactose transaminase
MAGKMGRYTNYQAALGLASMKTVDEVVAARRANAERLIANLEDILHFQKPMGPDVHANYMLVTALVADLDAASECLLRAGVDTKHLYMRDCSKMFDQQANFPNAARAEREVLHLPAHPWMSIAEIDRLSERIRTALKSI